MKRPILIAIIISSAFLFGAVLLAGWFIRFLYINDILLVTARNKGPEDYKPRFENADIELIYGKDLYVYYKTDKALKVGQDAGLDFIVADNVNDPDEYRIRNFPGDVVYAGKGFVVSKLPVDQVNPDCLFVYEDQKPVNFYLRDREMTIPKPSDAWMCSGFEPENFVPLK